MSITITNIAGTDRPADSRSVINTNFTNLKNAGETLQSEMTAVQADITTVETDITTAQTNLTNHEADTSTHGVAQVAGIADIPVKATASEVATGTNDAKFATPLAVAPYANYSMARQAVVNGNFDIWQRGTTSAISDSSTLFLADQWRDYANKDGGTLPTLTRSQQSLTPGDIQGSFYFSRLATNGAGTSLGANSVHEMYQIIEHGVRYLCGAGKSVTISFYARSSIANKRLGVYIKQYYGSGGSPTAAEEVVGSFTTLTSSWVKYTFTIATNTLVGKTFGTNNDDGLYLYIYPMWGSSIQSKVGASSAETYVGSGNIDIAQVQLCSGTVALPFQPKTFEDELHRCQRYYEKSYQYGVLPGAVITAGNDTEGMNVGTNTTNRLSLARRFRVPKRVDPTFTVYDWAGTSGKIDELNTSDTATDGITPAYTNADPSGFYVSHNPSTKSGIAFAWTASAEI